MIITLKRETIITLSKIDQFLFLRGAYDQKLNEKFENHYIFEFWSQKFKKTFSSRYTAGNSIFEKVQGIKGWTYWSKKSIEKCNFGLCQKEAFVAIRRSRKFWLWQNFVENKIFETDLAL